MKFRRVATVLIIAGVGLIVWWFVANFDLQAETTEMGPSATARKDPYLAVERLADRLGVPTEGFESIASVPENSMVVYLGGDRAGFVGRRQDDLVHWVERGGHLILVVQEPVVDDAWEDEDVPVLDELLTRLGITAYPVLSSSTETIATGLPGDPRRKVEVEMDGIASLTSLEEPIFQIKNSRGSVVLLSVTRGFGRVSAMVDDDWATNEKIAEKGHATLFWELVKGSEPSGLWVVRGDQLPGFLKLLGRYAWPALIGFGVLVILWVMRVSGRFGPLLAEELPERRSLLEHLDAAGRFMWRCHAHEPMLRTLRNGLVREIGRRRPAWTRLGDEERISRLAELSELSEQRVRTALLAENIEGSHGFVLAVKDLKRMESNL